jgi:hypothetical protein
MATHSISPSARFVNLAELWAQSALGTLPAFFTFRGKAPDKNQKLNRRHELEIGLKPAGLPCFHNLFVVNRMRRSTPSRFPGGLAARAAAIRTISDLVSRKLEVAHCYAEANR